MSKGKRRLAFHRLAGGCKLGPEVWTATRPGDYMILGFIFWDAKRRCYKFKPDAGADEAFDVDTLKDAVRFMEGLKSERKRCRRSSRRG